MVFKGAGVLPYSIDPLSKEPIILLGRECRPDKIDVHSKFCEFGGHCREGELPQETAIRELYEETSGYLKAGYADLSKPFITYASKDAKEEKNRYYTFLLKCTYDPKLIERFNRMIGPKALSHSKLYGKQSIYEKSELRWWKISDLHNFGTDILFHDSLMMIVNEFFSEALSTLGAKIEKRRDGKEEGAKEGGKGEKADVKVLYRGDGKKIDIRISQCPKCFSIFKREHSKNILYCLFCSDIVETIEKQVVSSDGTIEIFKELFRVIKL